MLENSNDHKVKDRPYEPRIGFGVANFCKNCEQKIPKKKRFCLKCEFDQAEAARLKKKKEKRERNTPRKEFGL